MWSIEWMNLFGNRESKMGPRPERSMPAVELRAFLDDYLNKQQQANAELARSHYLGLRALLRDIRDSQGHISHQMERIMSKISDFGAAIFRDSLFEVPDDIKRAFQTSPGTV